MTTLLRRAPIGALALALVAAAPGGAQQSGPRWQAWYGCWTPALMTGQLPIDPKTGPLVCIEATENTDVAQISSFAGGKVVSTDTVYADGAERPVTTKECSGVQSARFSADERRVYLRSSMACGSQHSTTTSILAMSPSGEWIDVRGLSAGGGNNVRVARYQAVDMRTFRADLPASLSDKLLAAQGARVAAGAPVGITAVVEATKNVDPAVVEAWLMERGQQFSIDAKTLVSLADAGVPSRVTDALVAVSNPAEFQVGRAEPRMDTTFVGQRIILQMDPWRWGGSGYGAYGGMYGLSPYDYYALGYGGYGGYGYGYSPYGYGTGYYYPPVIVVTGGSAGVVGASPRVVKGRGYTQGTGSATSTRSPSPSSSSSSSTPPPTEQKTTEQRTAHPRP